MVSVSFDATSAISDDRLAQPMIGIIDSDRLSPNEFALKATQIAYLFKLCLFRFESGRNPPGEFCVGNDAT